MSKRSTSTSDTIDPVCQMRILPGRKHIVSIYNDQNYYFCAEACRQLFEKDPQKYLTPMPAKRKGMWGKYLERLNKATGGKPPKCCH